MGLRYLREIQEGERESEPWERETYQEKEKKKGKVDFPMELIRVQITPHTPQPQRHFINSHN